MQPVILLLYPPLVYCTWLTCEWESSYCVDGCCGPARCWNVWWCSFSGRVGVSRRSLALPSAPGMSLSLPLQCGPAHMLGMSLPVLICAFWHNAFMLIWLLSVVFTRSGPKVDSLPFFAIWEQWQLMVSVRVRVSTDCHVTSTFRTPAKFHYFTVAK